MSLLMDALRKAEADKDQADKAAQTDHTPAATSSEAPSRRPSPAEENEEQARGPADSDSRVPDPGAVAQPDSGNIPTRPEEGLELQPIAERDVPDEDEDLAATVDLQKRHGKARAPRAEPERTSILASTASIEPRLADQFDDPQSVTCVSAAEVATEHEPGPEFPGAGQTTVVTAQTVFDAGSRGPSRRLLGLSIAMVGILAVVLFGIGVFYLQKTPATRPLPSPLVADAVEKKAPKELPVVPLESRVESDTVALVRLEPTQSIEDAAAAADSVDPVAMTAAPGEELVAEPTKPESVDYPAEPEIPAPTPRAPEMPSDPADAGTSMAAVVENERPSPTLEDRVSAKPEVGVRPGEVRIARSPRPVNPDEQLNSAYRSFIAGDLAAAEQLYRQVLAVRPKQRDASLGMGAIALRSGRVEEAYRYYGAVLERYPEDATANAALFMLAGGAGDRVTESRLKLLLDQGADISYIHFALGNLYVRQDRWADAQQAFFSAYRNDSGNADYSFNLAVSLDRIGERKAALGYYQEALALADESGGSFNTERLLERIQSLAATNE